MWTLQYSIEVYRTDLYGNTDACGGVKEMMDWMDKKMIICCNKCRNSGMSSKLMKIKVIGKFELVA